VGKTTSAYLMAKALMCRGQNPLGCDLSADPKDLCPSCQAIKQDGLDQQPDFLEVDAATLEHKAESAREIVEKMSSFPVLARRRVTVMDEAHFLSDEAWGAYLKILEESDTDSVFIFVSSAAGKIRKDIQSRCIRTSFERVADDVMIGHLANVANTNGIAYELDGLRLITRQARGIVRDAVQYLDTTAALGETVTIDTVKLAVDTSLEDLCENLLQTIAARKQVEAVALAEELVRKDMPGKAAERMLSLYSRAIYDKDPELRKIYLGLPDVSAVAGTLAKWAAIPSAPSDIITVIVYELLKTQNRILAHGGGGVKTLTPVVTSSKRASPLAAMLDDEAL
jgi:DNA polymerase III subunit gamma/tau